MFIPCDHCLRKHATQRATTREGGKRVELRLCNDCYGKHTKDAALPAPKPHSLFEKKLHPPINELEIARQVMAALVPRNLPKLPGYDLGAYCRSSPKVGGDHYAFVTHPTSDADRIGLLIADAAGRGVPTAIAMTETSALIRSEGRRAKSPVDLFSKVNRILFKDLNRGMFITAYYVQLELSSGRLTCVSAGHTPMIVWRKGTGRPELINPNGLALAIDPGPTFERLIQQQVVQLGEGDRFTLYTDGVVDARNEKHQRFGDERLYEELGRLTDRPSGELLHDLMETVERHCGKAPQDDDYAAITVRRLPKA